MLKRVCLLTLSLLSHYRLHKAQGLFLLLGLSLGVSLFLSTLLISKAAKQAFQKAQSSLAGELIAEIKPRYGLESFSDDVYRELRLAGFHNIHPIVEGSINTSSGFIRLHGIDLFTYLNQSGDANTYRENPFILEERPLTGLLNTISRIDNNSYTNPIFGFAYPPHFGLITESYAKTLSLSKNDNGSFQLEDATLPDLIKVDDELGLGYTLLFDMQFVQQALDLRGRLTSIQITAHTDAQLAAMSQILGDEARLETLDKNVRNPAFTDAFLLNLKGIGFLAFLVGCFIAFNAMSFSVSQRRLVVKQMRLCGADAQEVALALTIELIFWAVCASIAGCILGWAVATILLPSVGLTLNQLFYNEQILSVAGAYHYWFLSSVISFFAVFASISPIFFRLAKEKPLSSPTQKNAIVPTFVVSLILFFLGLSMVLSGYQSQAVGLLIAACWFLSAALLVPFLISSVISALGRHHIIMRLPLLQWALADARRDQARSSIAMMTFSISMAAAIAVLTMVTSFEITFREYLDDVLAESLYLNLPESQVDDVTDYLQNNTSVALSYRYYQIPASIDGTNGFARSLSNNFLRHKTVTFEAAVETPWEKLHARNGVMINQALALNQSLSPGDEVNITINNTHIRTYVLATYFSYGSLKEGLVIDEKWLRDLAPDLHSQRIGIFLNDNASETAFIERLLENVDINTSQYVRPSQLKELAHTIFQQTFLTTHLLTIAILIVAAIGVFCHCYTSQLAKTKQRMLIHILGVERNTLCMLALFQLSIGTVISGIAAIPFGLSIAWASINVVLRFSFGWYFPLEIDWPAISTVILAGILGTGIGALIPLLVAHHKSDMSDLKRHDV